MLIATDQTETGQPAKLATEGPLFGKDEQGMATERARKLGEKALEKWHSLNEKIRKKFKK